MSHLALVPEGRDLLAEELMYDIDGVTIAIEKVDGVLKLRAQDGPDAEPVMFDLHSVAPMLLRWIVKDERACAHRQEQDADWMAWDTIEYLLSRLFPREED